MENINILKGIIFSILEKTGQSKKVDTPDWRMCIVKLEIDANVNGKLIKSFPEFIFDWNVSFDQFNTGDYVKVDYYFVNKKIKKKDGTGIWEKEEKRIVFAKHADIESEGERPAKATPVKEQEKVFVTPDPDQEYDSENLPF